MTPYQWLAVALWTVCVLLLVRAVWPPSYRPWNRIRRRPQWTMVEPEPAPRKVKWTLVQSPTDFTESSAWSPERDVEVVPEWPALRNAYRFPIPKEPAAADLLKRVRER